MKGQAYYSSPQVYVSSGSGIYDVSDDVVECSVTKKLDASSTASASLNNYSNTLQGRYNDLFKPADTISMAYRINDTVFKQFAGYVTQAPQFAYDAANFKLQAMDIIGMLKYKLWAPASNEAISKFFEPFTTIVGDAQEMGINDSALGNVMMSFLMEVCGLSKNMIYIEKFPDLNDVMKNILKQCCLKGDPSYEAEFQKVFEELFGDFLPSSGSSNASGNVGSASGNAMWSGWQKKYPMKTGIYATGNNQGSYLSEQCWACYESYCNYLFGWATPDSPMLHQPDDSPNQFYDGWHGNGAYWHHIHDHNLAEGLTEILNEFDVIEPTATAQTGDVVFWDQTGGTVSGQYKGYGHVAIVLQDNGSWLQVENQWQGQPLTSSDMPKNADNYILAGYLRPKIFTNNPPTAQANADASSAQNTALNDTYKLFQWVNGLNLSQNAELSQLDKYDNLYLNSSVTEYLSQLCNGSMRTFTTLPDGSFSAFVPDYFGFFAKATGQDNLITIDDVDLVDYTMNIDHASYKSHIYLLTNEQTQNLYQIGNWSDQSLPNIIRLAESSGTISMQEQPEALSHFLNIQMCGFQQNAQGFKDLLDKWGIAVDKPTAMYIISHVMTTIEALYLMCKAWANVYKTTLQLAFRPDIMPGMRLKIPALDNVEVFVDSVTHSWSASSGGSTTVQTTATTFPNGTV